MFTILSDHIILTGLILLFLLFSIICQIISAVIYQNMINQADNMSSTENKLLKQCKQKYTSHYKLNGKMINTSVFVDKFLQKISVGGIYLFRLSHISGQLMMLSVLITGITICYLLSEGNSLFQIMPYYLVSILGLYLYFSISGIVDIHERRKILKTNLTDYLENYFVPRLESEKESAMEEGVKKREKYAHEFMEDKKGEEKARTGNFEEQAQPVVKHYQDELENLLEEFFA